MIRLGALVLLLAIVTAERGYSLTIAPDPNRRLSELAYEHWNMDSGLPQNTILGMAQDHTGYLWLGSFNGLAKFDGRQFLPFTDNSILELAQGITTMFTDQDGTLWAGSQGAGVVRIGADGTIDNFPLPSGNIRGLVWVIYRSARGQLWIGTNFGLCQLLDDAIECFDESHGAPTIPVSALHDGPGGSLLIGTDGDGFYSLEDNQFRSWTQVDGTPVRRIRDIEIDRKGRIWVATFGAGLMYVADEQLKLWERNDELAIDLISSLLADEHGLWIGSYGAGLYRLLDERLDRLDSGTGLPNGHIQSFLIDAEGSFWFGTNGGLNRLRNAAFATISTREHLSGPFVRTVAQSANGDLWVGTDSHGLNVIRDGRVISVFAPPVLPSRSVRSIWPARDGGLWVGAYGGGVIHLDVEGNRKDVPLESGQRQIRALFEDRDGNLWVASDQRGLTRLAPDGNSTWWSRGNGMTTSDVRSVGQAPDGSIYIGTYGHGIYRYADNQLGPTDLLPKGIVFSFTFLGNDEGWLGTQGGLRRLEGSSRVAEPKTLDGFTGAVFQALPDGQGGLWLCTNRGVMAVRIDDLRGTNRDVAATQYEISDGMRSTQCNGASQPAGWRDTRGQLWFPTADGVSWVDPARLPKNSRRPPVVIQAVRVDGNVVDYENTHVVVAPGARRIEIDFAALSFVSADKQSYRYRMTGHDQDWVNPKGRRTAWYNDLSPGDYTFQVIAANADGIWNSDGAQITIDAQPLLHQATWFRALLIALALLAIFGFMRWRVADLRRQKDDLARQVAERTDALQHTNANLEQTLSELRDTQAQLVEVEKMAALGSLVAGVAHEINTPVGNGLTITTHLLGQADKEEDSPYKSKLRSGLGLIKENMERAASIVARFKRIAVTREGQSKRPERLVKILEAAHVAVAERLQANGSSLSIDCPMELSVHVYPNELIEAFTQLLNNSIEHGFAEASGEVSIHASEIDGAVKIEYRDSGSGIDATLRDTLFEPFSTRHRGTHAGLGMHIVFNIITHLHGGELKLMQGDSTGFEIRLPQDPQQ